MSDAEFDATLAKSIDETYRASTQRFDAGLRETRQSQNSLYKGVSYANQNPRALRQLAS
jgi:hypothetical protein